MCQLEDVLSEERQWVPVQEEWEEGNILQRHMASLSYLSHVMTAK